MTDQHGTDIDDETHVRALRCLRFAVCGYRRYLQCGHYCLPSANPVGVDKTTWGEPPWQRDDDPSTCCRCKLARVWFFTDERLDIRAGNADPTPAVSSPVCGETVMQPDHITLVSGRRQDFVDAWRQSEEEPVAIEWSHPGWHAGLRRPNKTYSPNLARELRRLDRYGVTNGYHTDWLCPCCWLIVREIPMWLFWHARGWSPAQARYLDALEQRTGVGQIDFPPHDRMPWSPTWTDAEGCDTRQRADQRACTRTNGGLPHE